MQERSRELLQKVYTGLGLGTVALVFQACYGTFEAIGLDTTIQGKVRAHATDKPVAGIKVSVEDLYTLTDEHGAFRLYVPEEAAYTLMLEDIDGSENGSFLPRIMTLSLGEVTAAKLDIPLYAAK
jgi:hypothetical protein